MAQRICTVDDCGRPNRARGLCSLHDARLRRTGSLELARSTPSERFWSKVNKNGPNGCWVWMNATGEGYGIFVVDRRRVGAHRWAYEALVGPIPEGLFIDHLCRNRICVNPAHLEPVTNQENMRRAFADHTYCPQGHVIDGLDSLGRRFCQRCSYNRTRAARGRPRKGYMFLGHTIVANADGAHGCRCGAYTTRTVAEAKVQQRVHREDLARERGLIE